MPPQVLWKPQQIPTPNKNTPSVHHPIKPNGSIVIFLKTSGISRSNFLLKLKTSHQKPSLPKLHCFIAASMAGLTRLGLTTVEQFQTLLHRRITSTRRFGSAAALQYDEYFSVEEEEILGDRKVESAAGWSPERGIQWVLIGAKKHLYAEKLSKLLEVPHISMGTLLRQELNPNSSLYKKIANSVNEGKLVPEDVIFGLLSKRLEEGYFNGENGFILDGIPRTIIQAEVLDQIADIDLVVNLRGAPESYVKRSLLRTGNVTPSVADMQNAATEKLRIYAEQGKALEDYYRKQKKLIDVQVDGAPGETWQGLLAALHLKHLNALTSSSQKLVS